MKRGQQLEELDPQSRILSGLPPRKEAAASLNNKHESTSGGKTV